MAIEEFPREADISVARAFVPVLFVPPAAGAAPDVRPALEELMTGSRVRVATWRRSQRPFAVLATTTGSFTEAQLRHLGRRAQGTVANADEAPWVIFGKPSVSRARAEAGEADLADALEIIRLIDPEPAVVLQADIAVYRTLLEDPRMLAVLSSVLAPLMRSGRRAELIDALDAFFEEDLSVSRAAQRLGVHRHTITHRLARASEILGTEPWVHPARMRFELALHARRLMTPRGQPHP